MRLFGKTTGTDSRARLLKSAFFWLFPLALGAGLMLQVLNENRTEKHQIHLNTDRPHAIAAARNYVQSQGIDAGTWKAFASAFPDSDLYRYFRVKPEAELKQARDLLPVVVVRVLLRSPDPSRYAVVSLSLDNQIVGFDLRKAALPVGGDPGEEPSMQLAETAVSVDPKMHEVFGQSHPEVATLDRTASGVTRRYTWRAPLRPLRELDMELQLTLQGSRVVGRSLKGMLDPAYVSRTLGRYDPLLQIFAMTCTLYLFVAGIYSLARYAIRATQKEVSHSRTLWTALLVSLMFIGVIMTGIDDTVLQSVSGESLPALGLIFTVIALGIAGAGIMVGIAYGSGEGDVREAHPGKLTSLDALITGKIFSQNVGASVLAGTAFAAWLLLGREVLQSLVPANASQLSLNTLKFPFMPAAWLSLFITQPAIAILVSVAGLIQPVAFVNRFVRNRYLSAVLLILFAFLTSAVSAASYGSVTSFLIAAAAAVACLLLPFYRYDVLAAVVSLIALDFASSLVRLAVMFPAWVRFAWIVAAVGLVTLVVETIAWRRGRVWTDEEVRPEYARHIAERQALQAEVSAAREAQLRLLPQSAPTIPGLSICASCLPARVVGGDFYDFFPLSGDRLGIFIAEGGNRGLASALSIALAKGYLMHASRRGDSPAKLIERLETTLGSILEAGVVRTSVAYAVVDVHRGVIDYARTGAYPKVVVTSADGLVPRNERELSSLREGSALIGAGDSVVFYTDGVARRIDARSSSLQEDWIQNLANSHANADSLHRGLFAAIGADGKTLDLEDDLTAIVIRCTRAGSALMEGVA